LLTAKASEKKPVGRSQLLQSEQFLVLRWCLLSEHIKTKAETKMLTHKNEASKPKMKQVLQFWPKRDHGAKANAKATSLHLILILTINWLLTEWTSHPSCWLTGISTLPLHYCYYYHRFMALYLGLPRWTITTHTQPFHGSVDFIRDNPGELVPEETNIHPLTLIVVINHPYLLSPSTTIHGILPIQSMCFRVFFHNLSPSFLWSTSWPGTLHFILQTFLHPIIIFFSQCNELQHQNHFVAVIQLNLYGFLL